MMFVQFFLDSPQLGVGDTLPKLIDILIPSVQYQQSVPNFDIGPIHVPTYGIMNANTPTNNVK